MEDGLLCRNDQDCMWLDEGLRCTDYKIDWSVASGWFNGDSSSIVGSCDCLDGFWYEESQISCVADSTPGGLSGVAIFFIVISVIVGACILCAFCVCVLRFFRS